MRNESKRSCTVRTLWTVGPNVVNPNSQENNSLLQYFPVFSASFRQTYKLITLK